MNNKCTGECYCDSCCECDVEHSDFMDDWKKDNPNATPEEIEIEENDLHPCRYCNGINGEPNDGNGDVRHCNFCENGCDCFYCTEEKVWRNGERDPRRNSNAYAYFPDVGGELQYNNGTFQPRSGNGYK